MSMYPKQHTKLGEKKPIEHTELMFYETFKIIKICINGLVQILMFSFTSSYSYYYKYLHMSLFLLEPMISLQVKHLSLQNVIIFP